MKRVVTIGCSFFVVVCLLAGAGWIIFMNTLNSRQTQMTVFVAGNVDEVRIYSGGDPVNPVASIRPDGRDTTRKIELPNAEHVSSFFQTRPAQYYFVSKIGEQSYRSGSICCQVGFFPEQRHLSVWSLEEWEVSSNRG